MNNKRSFAKKTGRLSVKLLIGLCVIAALVVMLVVAGPSVAKFGAYEQTLVDKILFFALRIGVYCCVYFVGCRYIDEDNKKHAFRRSMIHFCIIYEVVVSFGLLSSLMGLFS